MATPPRKDNVVRFRQPDRTARGGTARHPNTSAPPRDLRPLIQGREGWIGLILIVALAVAIVAWQRLAG